MVEHVYPKRSHFPLVLWKNVHKCLCYVGRIPALQEHVTDTCSKMLVCAQKCFPDMLELGIVYQEAVAAGDNCALKDAVAPSFEWFQEHAVGECVPANKPITPSLEDCILNVVLCLSSHCLSERLKDSVHSSFPFVSWSTSFPESNRYLLVYNILSHRS